MRSANLAWAGLRLTFFGFGASVVVELIGAVVGRNRAVGVCGTGHGVRTDVKATCGREMGAGLRQLGLAVCGAEPLSRKGKTRFNLPYS